MSAPLSYQDALATAAAIHAAGGVPDPVGMTANMANRIITTRETSAQWAKTAIRALWRSVNPYSDKEVNAFAAQAADLMAPAQTAVARAAAAAMRQQLAVAGVHVDGVTSDPIDVRAPTARIADGTVKLEHHTVNLDYANDDTAKIKPADMTTEAVFKRPAAGFRWVESQGGDAAQQSGLRIDVLVDDNLMLAQRLAQQEVLAEAVDLDTPSARITGYRRVIHPELSRSGVCGMCIAAADRVYHVGTLMPIHKNCKCTIAPVTTDHDPADTLNTADLKTLYKHAGGTSVAHLKRTRYQIDDHGELGPVLVPAAKYKPRTPDGRPYQSSGRSRKRGI